MTVVSTTARTFSVEGALSSAEDAGTVWMADLMARQGRQRLLPFFLPSGSSSYLTFEREPQPSSRWGERGESERERVHIRRFRNAILRRGFLSLAEFFTQHGVKTMEKRDGKNTREDAGRKSLVVSYRHAVRQVGRN